MPDEARTTTRRPARRAAVTFGLVALLAFGIWRGMRGTGDEMAGMPGMDAQPAVVVGRDGVAGAGDTAVPEPSAGMPGEIAGLVRTDVVTGPDALQRVAHMHGREDIAIVDATIAWYGGPDTGMEVWVGLTRDGAGARTLTRDMADGIATGRSPFTPGTWSPGRRVWRTTGNGQVHYFFARGRGVWWLSVDEALADAALGDVLALAEAS